VKPADGNCGGKGEYDVPEASSSWVPWKKATSVLASKRLGWALAGAPTWGQEAAELRCFYLLSYAALRARSEQACTRANQRSRTHYKTLSA